MELLLDSIGAALLPRYVVESEIGRGTMATPVSASGLDAADVVAQTVVTGPTTLIEAAGHGKKAAYAVDRYQRRFDEPVRFRGRYLRTGKVQPMEAWLASICEVAAAHETEPCISHDEVYLRYCMSW